ncbi:hypothetical protein [Promicromonospora sp. NPDC019610]|uniref:hypothetical protein n=1 Tax=Promicromonospora sp. NPDC019610 TaxID=3364405 RepID=UPI00378F60A8
MRALLRYSAFTATAVVLVLVLRAGDQPAAARWVATAWVGGFVVWTLVGMVRDVLRGHVGLDVLAVVAMVATLAVHEYVASVPTAETTSFPSRSSPAVSASPNLARRER